MKFFKALRRLYNNWDAIWQLLTSDWFLLVTQRTTPKINRRRINSTLTNHNDIVFVLEDSATQLKNASQAADTLFNTLGIKRADE